MTPSPWGTTEGGPTGVVKVCIHFVPAGVAGVPNTQQLTLTLVKKGKKKK